MSRCVSANDAVSAPNRRQSALARAFDDYLADAQAKALELQPIR
ncbi:MULTISPECIES: hypothetical protein [Pseudomonas]|nr:MULTISPECIES: hypothetical protein [Pseudomonas]